MAMALATHRRPFGRFSLSIGCVSAKEPDGQSGSYVSLQRLFHLALPLKQFSK